MQFYFAVATATFIALLSIVAHEQWTFENTKEWAIYLLGTFIISLFWPLILIGLIIEMYCNITKGTNQ